MGEAPVTIAVVNTNAHDLLAACLRSIEPEVNAGLAEAWVVDNASADGSPEMVEREFPWVHLVASPENLGFPQAANLAADRTSGQWFATANEDIELTPGALETLLEAAERHPEAAIIAPRLVLPDGSTQHTVYSFPTFLVTAAHHLGLQRLSRRLGGRVDDSDVLQEAFAEVARKLPEYAREPKLPLLKVGMPKLTMAEDDPL